MLNTKYLSKMLITVIVVCCLLITSACSQRYSGSSAGYDTTSDYYSEYDSYSENNDTEKNINSDNENYRLDDSDSDSDKVSKSSMNDSSQKRITNKNRTNKEVKNTKKTTKKNIIAVKTTKRSIKRIDDNSFQTARTTTKITKDYDNSDYLHKNYYLKGFVGQMVSNGNAVNSELTRKPYSFTDNNIPESDVVARVYDGERMFSLEDIGHGKVKVLYKNTVCYFNTWFLDPVGNDWGDHFAYLDSGVSVKKYNDEWVASNSTGPIFDYFGIAPSGNSYWLICSGKVNFDVSGDLQVFCKDSNNNEKQLYLVIDEGEMVAIKSSNNIILWSN